MEDGHCVRTVHAEPNAIVQAARNGTRLEGASIYVTGSPCWPCQKLILNAGITTIVFGEDYRGGMYSKVTPFEFAVMGIQVAWLDPDGALVTGAIPEGGGT